MLYPKNNTPKLSPELFKNPTSEYRCTPFWAWNCDLKADELTKEIDFMKEMGMGGFHMHTRVGMSTTYLSDEYMALASVCNEKAKKEEMLCWLYDEDKWPSGFAGGYVTKNEEHRNKFILFTTVRNEDCVELSVVKRACAEVTRNEGGILLGKYDVVLDDDGYMTSYRMIKEGDAVQGRAWYAYMQTPSPNPWFNFGTYVDTLSKPALDEFVRITHERYYEVLGDDFGKSVPAIFTDEPQHTPKGNFHYAHDTRDVCIPYTSDFEDTFKAEYGVSFIETLPEVFWDIKGQAQTARYRYHNHVADRFVNAFGDNIGKWCDEHGIMLTGHMMSEASLCSQTVWVSDCMRALRGFGLPGIDMLCDLREFTTAKQAQSTAHQYGRPGVMSELYGVTNWDFDFRGHKLQGDWQAALGISVRVPHLYWVNMAGEAKRDYPASIGHQSSWYDEYSHIEDHFARVNTLMTRGTPNVRIAVIHPVESLWMQFGANDVTGEIKKKLETEFSCITNWLINNNLDFDYLCEANLPELYEESDNGFKVGHMTYDAVVIPGCRNIRSTTLEYLKKFASKGGKLILIGEAPIYVDAQYSDEAKVLAELSEGVVWDEEQVISALEGYRTVNVHTSDGVKTKNIIYGMRRDGDGYNLFICHSRNCNRAVEPVEESYVITVNGEFAPTLLDTETGDIRPMPARYENGNTLIEWTCYSTSSILLRLENGRSEISAECKNEEVKAVTELGKAELVLHESNVCILDMARWKLDDGEWQDKEETLRLCVKAKESLGMSTGTADHAQPWVFPAVEPKNTIELEFKFNSEIEVEDAFLALEDRASSTVIFNGNEIDNEYVDYYIDFSIHKIKLGKINKGENVIVIKKPFSAVTNVENIFVLGDFGVKIESDKAIITEPVRELEIGDFASQGLSFYGGKLTYRYKVNGGKNLKLKLGIFTAPCVIVKLDGKRMGNVSLAPHVCDLGYLSEGDHVLELEVSASRINTFGPLHITSAFTSDWFGPRAWRTEGKEWSYDYFIKKAGLLTAPKLIEC